LVQNEDKITAVLVSSINDSRDVVIKSLGHYMGKISGFIGATILGDGSVIPVLDIPELLRTPTHAVRGAGVAVADTFDAHSNQPSVLVVDDSLSQRRALEQILQDAGYKVYIARDGIEAVEFLSHAKPDVVLTDLEMPRMNGIELISHIRTQARTKHLPIIMITSRTTQKHKQMAQDAGADFYFSKPVQDEELSSKIHDLITATEQGART
jgi:chemosensory pili system protein ChpA (sensor histidine kinase/response regulator)